MSRGFQLEKTSKVANIKYLEVTSLVASGFKYISINWGIEWYCNKLLSGCTIPVMGHGIIASSAIVW